MIEGNWMSRESFCNTCKIDPTQTALSPLLRLLLLSDGTMTHILETLFLEKIGFELKEQSEIIPSEEEAHRLSIPKGEKVIKRQGWLVVKKSQKRVLYVDSILSCSQRFPSFYQEISLGEKPLGQIIEDQNLLARRDQIEIGRFPLHQIAGELGSSDPLIWARRYRLTLSGERSALLFEAVSPKIVDCIPA